jgi:D-amino-acid dehydrogenase
VARIAIVGAGVVGVATAWQLCRDGHEVTLLDAHAGRAVGASHANGAQLSYAYGDALATPGLLAHLPAILLGRDPAFRIRLQADPEFLLWGLRFLANAHPARFAANSRHLLEMAAETRDALPGLLRDMTLDVDHAVRGKMILYPTDRALAATAAARALKREMGIRQEVLDRAAATRIEPALDLYPDAIAGVVWSPDDAAGRPDRFCGCLVEALRRHHGLRTLFGAEVRALLPDRDRVAGLLFVARQPLEADAVVLATGAAVGLLPFTDRLRVPIWPVQGYSLTARATSTAMGVSITDAKRKLVFARLGEEVRVAGLADIGPRRPRFDPARFASFRQAAIRAFGGAFEGEDAKRSAWSGGRPCTPSSRPVIRAGSRPGLFLNIGHGTLGWTLCIGAAQHLAALLRAATTRATLASDHRTAFGTAR